MAEHPASPPPEVSATQADTTACAALARCCELLLEHLDKSQNPSSPSFGKQTTELAKTISAVAAALVGSAFVFYSLGYIIVNLYLLSYGAQETTLTNPSYLASGLGYFIFLLAPMLALLLLAWHIKQAKWFRLLIGFAVLYPLWHGVLLQLYLDPSFAAFAQLNIPGLLQGSGASITIWLATIVLALLLHALRRDLEVKRSDMPAAIATMALILAIVLPISLSQWATGIYPRANSALGGGAPTTVVIVLKPRDDAAQQSLAEELGIAQRARNSTVQQHGLAVHSGRYGHRARAAGKGG